MFSPPRQEGRFCAKHMEVEPLLLALTNDAEKKK
jgi:hypothetical protein